MFEEKQRAFIWPLKTAAIWVLYLAFIGVCHSQTITLQPQSQTVASGSTANFYAQASGDGNLNYQWLFNGVAIYGATNATFRLDHVEISNSGKYQVVVTGNSGSIVSDEALLTVEDPIIVVNQPQSVNVTVGANVDLEVKVTGTSPITYQWQHDESILPGATNAVLSLIKVSQEQAGNYRVVISNGVSSVASSNAFVLVEESVTFLKQPVSVVATPGQKVAFSAQVSGSPPIFYQWMFNGVVIHDATNNSIQLLNVTFEQAGAYSVLVGNAFNTLMSSNATLDVQIVPSIVEPPQSVRVDRGETVAFTVTAAGSGPLSYQWLLNGDPLQDEPNISGANTATLIITEAGYDNAGSYSVIVNNQVGYCVSDEAILHLGTLIGVGENIFGECEAPEDATNLIALAAGGAHCLAVRSDGTVVAWGNNSHGQAEVPEGLTNAIAVAAGAFHSLALKADGTVVGWGYDPDGNLSVPSSLSNVVAIAAGSAFNMALKNDGSVVAWGDSTGEMELPNDLGVTTAISAKGSTAMALRSDGSVRMWGFYRDFIEGHDPLTNIVAISAGRFHGLALRADGTVVTVGGWPKKWPMPAGLSNVVAISAGQFHSLALQSDGKLVAWGNNQSGQCNMPGFLTNVVKIVAGDSYNLILLGDGRVFSIQEPPSRKDILVREDLKLTCIVQGDEAISYKWFKNGAPLTDGGQVAAALSPSLTIRAVGYSDEGHYTLVSQNSHGVFTNCSTWVTVNQVFGWGDNEFSQLYTPMGLKGIIALAAGDVHSLALRADGKVIAWGNSDWGQADVPANLAGVAAIAAGGWHSLALKSDGTIAAWGLDDSGQCDVPVGLHDVVSIASGRGHNLALQSDGTVVAWGSQDYRKCAVPAGLSNVIALAAGYNHSVALKSDGTVVAWGDNRYGQCAAGMLSDVVSIAAGAWHTVALRRDGSVAAWGYNEQGQCSVPDDLNNVVAVQAGTYHSLALKANGDLLPWGYNGTGQSTPQFNFKGTPVIAAGYHHNLALRSDSTPFVVQQPSHLSSELGGNVTLSLVVTGENPMQFAWYKDGKKLEDGGRINGSHTAQLVISGIQLSDLGHYWVEIVNDTGSVSSPAGSISFDGAFPLMIRQYEPENGVLSLSFDTLNEYDYLLQTTPEFKGTNTVWTTVITNHGTGAVLDVDLIMTNEPSKYFRVLPR